MKRFLSNALIVFWVITIAVGCANNPEEQKGLQNTSAVANVNRDKNNGTVSASELQEIVISGDINIDFKMMSNVAAHAVAENIIDFPENYYGKTMRVIGNFLTYHNELSNSYYHVVAIYDEFDCCEVEFEFIMNGEYIYPADYPEEETKIGITGVFISYEEYGRTWYYLLADNITMME